jgi:hypothetical protein
MEASPRGPNHPMKVTVAGRGRVPEPCEGNGQHSYDGQAEDRVDHDLPGHLLEGRAEEHCPKTRKVMLSDAEDERIVVEGSRDRGMATVPQVARPPTRDHGGRFGTLQRACARGGAAVAIKHQPAGHKAAAVGTIRYI